MIPVNGSSFDDALRRRIVYVREIRYMRAFASILCHRLSNLSSFGTGKRLSEETECREGRRA
jgi:hypothetical protein